MNFEEKQLLHSILSSAGIVENKFVEPAQTNHVAVFMSGCPASAKSTIIDNQLLLDGQIFSTDKIADLWRGVLNRKYNQLPTAEAKAQFAADYDNKIPVDRDKEFDEDETNYWYDLVSRHLGDYALDDNGDKIIDEITNKPKRLGLKTTKERIFMNANKDAERPENMIFDITGESEYRLIQSILLTQSLGYYTVLVCAVIGLEKAFWLNEIRKRHESEALIERVHKIVYRQIPESLHTGRMKALDEAWVVFTGDFNIKTKDTFELNGKPQKIISNKGWSDNTAFRLIKQPDGIFTLPDKEIEKRFEETIGHGFYEEY